MHRLAKTIPAARMAPYEAACTGSDIEAIELYRWASAVAMAMFDDLSVLEVAMRSAMAREPVQTYGIRWFRRHDLLDDSSIAHVDDALRRGRLVGSQESDDVVHGRLVASLMLGFWVRLLGRGAHHGVGPERERRIYDSTLWQPALHRAFPSVRKTDRASVESAARRMQALRNRIAHHEHIVWGVPLPGVRDRDGAAVRLSARECQATLMTLASQLDPELAGWLADYSQVSALLGRCPLDRGDLRAGGREERGG